MFPAAVATAATVGAAAVSAGVGIYGATQMGKGGGGGSPGYVASQNALAQAGAQFNNLDPPDVQDLQIRLQQAVFAGKITPIQAVAILQQDTKLAGIQVDPRTKFAQFQALDRMARTVDMNGMTEEDKAHLFSTMTGQKTDEAGARGRFEQGLAERGLSDQNSQELERSVAGQAGANRGAKTAIQAAADAEARKEEASKQAGILAGNIRSQSFDEQSQRARAQDAINAANATAQNNARRDNLGARRDARDYNANTRQQLSDINTGIQNQQNTANAAAMQRDYDNRMAIAQGQASAYGSSASGSRAAANAAGQRPGIGETVLGIAGSVANAYSNWPTKK